MAQSAYAGASPKSFIFWVRVGVMVMGFAGVLYLMQYLRSGELQRQTSVQGFLNPPARVGHVVIDHKDPASPPSEPAKDR